MSNKNNSLPLVLAFVAAAAFGLTVSMKTAAAAPPPPHPPHSVRREALNTELLQLKRDADAEKAASAREDRQTRAVAEIPAEQVIVTEHPASERATVNKTMKRLTKAQAAAREYAFEEMFIEHPHLDTIDSALKERTISTRVKSVFVMHAKPNSRVDKKELPILMLHGAKFSSKTWDTTGTISALCEAGFDVYAVDLPGYGRSEGKVDAPLREVFLAGIIDRLKLNRPIVVSPSMSGSFSVPLILEDPAKLSAFVSVAAVRVSKLADVDWSAINVIALHMYGELDTQIGVPGAEAFKPKAGSSKRSAQIFQMNGATHACYLDNPKAFNKRLLKFVNRAEGLKGLRKVEKVD